MVTQRHTLTKKVKELEQELRLAVLNHDPNAVSYISNEIEIAKSTLLNLD
jgi:hypothetical protein